MVDPAMPSLKGHSDDTLPWIFADFIGRSLVPWVESHYPSASRSRSRVILGSGPVCGRIMNRFPRFFGGAIWLDECPSPQEIPEVGEVPVKIWLPPREVLGQDLKDFFELREGIQINPEGPCPKPPGAAEPWVHLFDFLCS